MDLANCRSCQARIGWVQLTTGGRHPVNAEPVTPTTIHPTKDKALLTDERGYVDPGTMLGLVAVPMAPEVGRSAYTVSQYTTLGDLRNHQLHVSHFATCPNASAHRRGDRR